MEASETNLARTKPCSIHSAIYASAITPVPGGVGPTTIAVLLRNTIVAAHRNEGLDLAEDTI